MNWEKIKNWVFGGAGAVALVIFYQFMQWQVSIEVAAQLKAHTASHAEVKDLATDPAVVAIKSDVQANARTGEENEEDIDELKQNVRAAFEVLMGE